MNEPSWVMFGVLPRYSSSNWRCWLAHPRSRAVRNSMHEWTSWSTGPWKDVGRSGDTNGIAEASNASSRRALALPGVDLGVTTSALLAAPPDSGVENTGIRWSFGVFLAGRLSSCPHTDERGLGPRFRPLDSVAGAFTYRTPCPSLSCESTQVRASGYHHRVGA